MKYTKFLIPLLLISTQLIAPALEKNKFSFDSQKEIAFGQSAFLSGSYQLYGELIRNAILARFNHANEHNELPGKTLKLFSVDDRGEANITEKNIQIMRAHNIDMFIGNMGTRGVFKVLPLITEKKIAMLFPWGGDEKLRKPQLTHLVNGLGLIKPQIDALATYVANTVRLTKVAVFHDDGDFGKANAQMMLTTLKQHEIEPVAIESYNRFTMDIKTPALKLIEADPKIVICLSTSMPAVKLINYFFEEGHYGTKFVGIDSTMFVGNILEWKGAEFHYASSVPDPKTSDLPIVKQFRDDLKKYFPNDPINILSLSYYIHASIVIEGLKKITGPLTKEKLLQEIEKMKGLNFGGFAVDFNLQTRHAYKHIISIVKG